MGQQQLLLLVLGIVIVGLAVVVGINAFSENRIKSNADAMVTDALRIATDVQSWALKPTQFGGGGGVSGGNDALKDLAQAANPFLLIGYPTPSGSSSGDYSNVNASFSIGGALAGTGCTEPDMEATADNKGPLYIIAENLDTKNCIAIKITGTNSNDIGTSVFYGQ